MTCPACPAPHPDSRASRELVTIEVTASKIDGAVLVFIDTQFEPDGSDDGPGLRVILNDSDVYVGVHPDRVPHKEAT